MADSLGEAFFLFLGEFLSLRETLPRQAQIASWQARISQTAPAFSRRQVAWAWARDISDKPFADLWKRGMIALEGRRSSFRGRMAPCGDNKRPSGRFLLGNLPQDEYLV